MWKSQTFLHCTFFPVFSCSPPKKISSSWFFLILIPSLLLTITCRAKLQLKCHGVSEVLRSIDLLRMYLRNHKEGNFCCITSVEVLGWQARCCNLTETAEQGIFRFFFVPLPLSFYVVTILAIRSLTHPCGGVLEIFLILKHHHLFYLLQKLIIYCNNWKQVRYWFSMGKDD